MDWQAAIEKNRTALLAIVASLCALIRLANVQTLIDIAQRRAFANGAPQLVTRAMRLHILRLLRPAEAAARRLVFAHYRLHLQNGGGFSTVDPARTQKPAPQPIKPDDAAKLRPQPLPLYDPEKDYGLTPQRKAPKHPPRILFPLNAGFVFTPPPVKAPTQLDDRLSANALFRRIAGLHIALHDVPKQAQRLARAETRRGTKPHRPVMRIGLPPGQKRRKREEVHLLLGECDWVGRGVRSNASDCRAPP